MRQNFVYLINATQCYKEYCQHILVNEYISAVYRTLDLIVTKDVFVLH